MIKSLKYIDFLIAIRITLMIIIISTSYISPDFSRGFLIGKREIFSTYKVPLYIHMFFAPLAILTGLFQFIFTSSKAHKFIGKIYVLSILLFAAPSGFYMAFYAIGGTLSTINFVLLSSLWSYFTLQAYFKIKSGDIESHKRFMTRSFILTNSAIATRLLSYIFNNYIPIDPVAGYQILVWLSWVPFLGIYEIKKGLTLPR